MRNPNHQAPALDRQQIAGIYNSAFVQQYGRDNAPQRCLEFADNVLARDARALAWVVNGLNHSAKRVFVQVTGVQLPDAQGKSWEMMRDWGGITAAQDALFDARNMVEIRLRSLKRDLGNSEEETQKVVAFINARLDEGLDRIVKVDRKYYLSNAEGMGICLSNKGERLHMIRPSIEAFIELRKAEAVVATEAVVEVEPAL